MSLEKQELTKKKFELPIYDFKNRFLMPKKGWLSLAGFVVMFFGILFGGPQLSAFFFRKYKEKIDKNGVVVPAQISLKILTKEG